MYKYKAIITNVVDGDTFDLDIDLGFHIHIHERIRLLGIDTPEKFGEEKELGLIVKEFAEYRFLGKEVIIKSRKKNTSAETDSFGRWLVNMSIDGDDFRSIYNYLGINKRNKAYSVDNVMRLKDKSLYWR